jgi:hypothetical protein
MRYGCGSRRVTMHRPARVMAGGVWTAPSPAWTPATA